MQLYKVCPEGIQPCTMKKIHLLNIQETLKEDNDTSVPLKAGTLQPHTVLPITISCPVIFSWMSSMVWNLFPFKGDFSFGKGQNRRVPNLGCRGAESPGWFDVSPENSAQDVMHEWAHWPAEGANHQVPRATFWIIWIVSTGEGSSSKQN